MYIYFLKKYICFYEYKYSLNIYMCFSENISLTIGLIGIISSIYFYKKIFMHLLV